MCASGGEKKLDKLGRRCGRIKPQDITPLFAGGKGDAEVARILGRQKRTVELYRVRYEQEEIRQFARLQKKREHLEDIRQKAEELKEKLNFPPLRLLIMPDLSVGETQYFDQDFEGVIEWERDAHGGYMLKFDKEFDSVMEHLRSSGEMDLLKKLEGWRRRGGECIKKCNTVLTSIEGDAQRKFVMAEVPETGQRGLLRAFSWRVFSWALSDTDEEPCHIIADEMDGLCLLHDQGGSSLAWIRPDEVDAVQSLHLTLRKKYRALPFRNEIVKMRAELDTLKESLTQGLDRFAKEEVVPGKCSLCPDC